jgi:hypothetical protein
MNKWQEYFLMQTHTDAVQSISAADSRNRVGMYRKTLVYAETGDKGGVQLKSDKAAADEKLAIDD